MFLFSLFPFNKTIWERIFIRQIFLKIGHIIYFNVGRIIFALSIKLELSQQLRVSSKRRYRSFAVHTNFLRRHRTVLYPTLFWTQMRIVNLESIYFVSSYNIIHSPYLSNLVRVLQSKSQYKIKERYFVRIVVEHTSFTFNWLYLYYINKISFSFLSSHISKKRNE